MKSRTIQVGASFAIVLVAYWTYALLAVPLIETQVKIAATSDKGGDRDGGNVDKLDWDLSVLFPKDAWERNNAKTISSNDRVLLVWKDYAPKPGNWVELNPLTLIFVRDETAADQAERLRHAIVMQVPAGANLRFDRPLDLKHGGGLGRLIEGQLRGEVTISSRGKRPDHQDDLWARTHDVALTEQRITTPNQVEFCYGQSWGRGRQLEIKLLPQLGPHSANQEGPDVGGIKQIEVEQLERMHLVVSQDEKLAAASGAAGTTGPAAKPDMLNGPLSSRSGPVEITCRGPFRFDLVDEQVATFRDQVAVERQRPDGLSDHMTCDVLSIFFARPSQAADGGKHHSGAPGFDLQPARIEARGSPTVLTAPMDHLQAWAELLKYNLADRQIFMADSKEVLVQRDRDEIHAPSVCYTPGPPGHNGMFQLLATGPGRLRGEMAGRPGQELEAQWQTKLQVSPKEQNQVVSLIGGAELKFQAMGQLDAQELYLWLREAPPIAGIEARRASKAVEVPTGSRGGLQLADGLGGPSLRAPAAGSSSFEPDRLLARGDVAGNSTQFSIKKADELDVWFTTAPPARGLQAAGDRTGMAPALGSPPTGAVDGTYAGNGGAVPPGSQQPGGPGSLPPGAYGPPMASAPASPPGVQNPAVAGQRQAHLDISGRLVKARVVLHDRQQGELTEAEVVDGVQVVETQTREINDLPLLVTGDWLHATEANSPQAKVTVRGKSAHMKGRGMSLTGPEINIDRGANLLTMSCSGEMERSVDRDLENRPLSRPSTVRITWERSMVFDGRKAHFVSGVKVRGETQLLETGWMDVYLQHPISFSEAPPGGAPGYPLAGRTGGQPAEQSAEMERIVCGEGVHIVNQGFDKEQQTGYDRIWFKDLDMNNITGDFQANGPGRVISVRRGGNQDFSLPGGPLAGAAMGGAPAQSPGGTPARAAAFAPGQPRPASGEPDPNQLSCLDLRFVSSLTGNKNRKEMTFHGNVRAAHAPASSWEQSLEDSDPKRLGKDAVVLHHCESLEVADMSPAGGRGNMEFQARDNVRAEGATFSAHCARLSYSQAKDQLIFEGDGRSDAELYKQEQEGGAVQPFKAQKIIYFKKTQQVNVDDFRSLEMNQPPQKPAPAGRR